MNLVHVALVCSSEENADGFYRDLLGLEKSAPRLLPASLSLAIFGIDSDLTMINYTGESVLFEIFIKDDHSGDGGMGRRIGHACLAVTSLSEILEKCRAGGFKVVQVPKGQSIITFISDHDGNLFEIKET